MAFSNTVIDRKMSDGVIKEYGTWAMTLGTTTGTITPATTGQGISAGIVEISDATGTSSSVAAAFATSLAANRKSLTLASTANDTGSYFIQGRVA